MAERRTTTNLRALAALALALAAALLLALAPAAAWAEESTTYDSSTHVASAVVDGTTTYYDTLADAISAADSESTVTLLASTTVSSQIQISKAVTLDLNGQTLTLDNSSSGSGSAARLLYITTAGDLTVKDGTATSDSSGSGTITNTGYSYGLFDVYGALTIESGKFVDQGSGDGALVRGRSGSTVSISGGSFTVSYSDYGSYSGTYAANYYGDFVLNATYCAVSITGGSYTVGQYCWGALELNTCTSADGSDTVTVSGATITTYDSVGIDCCLTDATISSCVITVQNESPIKGSPATAVGVNNQSVVTITSGTYSGPYAVYVYNTGGTVTIEDGTYTGTVAALISDADIVQTYYDDDGEAAEGTEGSTIIVTGGTIDGKVVENESSQAVAESTTTLSGGTYTDDSALEYLDETSSYTTSTSDDGTTTYTLTADAYVAKVTTTTTGDDGEETETTTYYATVQGAVDAAASGSTVTLLCDVSGSSQIGTAYNVSGTYILYVYSGKNLTLDLGGHTMTLTDSYLYAYGSTLTIKNGTIADERCASSDSSASGLKTIYVYSSTLALESVTITAYAPTSSWNYVILGYNGDETISLDEVTITDLSSGRDGFLVGVFLEGYYYNSDLEAAQAEGAYVSTLSVESSTISVTGYAVAGDGAWHGTSISISDSTLTSTTATAIYHPQYGTMTIDGCTITGAECGIEVRAGTVIISNSTVASTETETLGTYANGSGTSVQGAGIAISQHSTDIAISVTITDCTVSGAAAVYEEDLMNEDSSDITLSIVSGTYTATGTSVEVTASDGTVTTTTETVAAVYSENCTGFISGGSFSTVVDSAYCAEGYSPTGAVVTVTNSDGTTSSYYTVAQGTIAFLGGSLRVDKYATTSTDSDGNESTTYTYTAADLRFGFNFSVPDGATVKQVSYYYGTAGAEALESAISAGMAGTLTTTSGWREADGGKTYSYDGTATTSGYISNLVFTGIATANQDSPIYVKMCVTYALTSTDEDGTSTTAEYTIYSDVVARDVLYVASAASSDSSYASSLASYIKENLSSASDGCAHDYSSLS